MASALPFHWDLCKSVDSFASNCNNEYHYSLTSVDVGVGKAYIFSSAFGVRLVNVKNDVF